MTGQVVWRARRQASGTVDTDLYDVKPLTDSINRFASSATLLFDDPTGDKKADYPRGQRVELEFSTDGGSTFTRRWAGSVETTTERSDGGADRVEVEVVGYDQWLRVRRVDKSYSSTKLSAILEDVIKNFTPVKWVAGNVTVQNDKTVSWDVEGTKADRVIDRVASASADEDYGVNDDFEFFFEQRETERAGSDIVDGDWRRYDLPEEGRDAVNRVDLFYGASGNRSRVIVEDRAAQRNLADDLGVSGNVVVSKEVTFERISNEAHAETKAREILNERSEVLTGTVTTFDRFDMDPGEVFRLQIGEKNIDADFRVAQIEYYWTRDETVVTVAENVGDVRDLLVQLADDVAKVDLRAADFSATANRFLDLRAGITASPDPGFTQVTIDADAWQFGFGGSKANNSAFGLGGGDTFGFRQTTTEISVVRMLEYDDDLFIFGMGGDEANRSAFGLGGSEANRSEFGLGHFNPSAETQSAVNTTAVTTGFLNQLRDVWQGESASEVSHVALGTGTDDAVSTDTALTNEVARAAVAEQGQPASTEIELTAAFNAADDPLITSNDIAEFGFFDAASGGTMFISGQSDAIAPTRRTELRVRVVVVINTDPETFGVVTTTGQERFVDLFLGNTGHEPTDLAFGTGTADASESDTSLGSKVIEKAVSTADRSRGVTDVEATLGTGEANGNTLSELGQENSANELLTRVVFEGLAKDSNFELTGNNITSARNA